MKQAAMKYKNRSKFLSDQPAEHSAYARAATRFIAQSACAVAGYLLASGAAHAQVLTKNSSSPAAQAPEPSLTYTVVAQDKLIVLSRTLFNGLEAWAGVAQYNGLKNPNLIYPGQTLQVPLRYLAAKPSSGAVISTSGNVSVGGQPLLPGVAIRSGQQFKTGLLRSQKQRDCVDIFMRARPHPVRVGWNGRIMEQAQHRIAVCDRWLKPAGREPQMPRNGL